MQGQTESSLAVWTAFNNYTTAYARILKWSLKISWIKHNTAPSYGIVGVSLIGGIDIVQGVNEGTITPTDSYVYWDETERLIRYEYDRSLIEPLGGISLCIGDAILDNIDGRFTPNQNATIGTAILPDRPIQMYMGFLLDGSNVTLPIFKGLTDQPKQDRLAGTVSIASYDYIKFLNESFLNKSVYTNKRVDEIIEDVLTGVGFSASQFELDEGIFTIPYAWIEAGEAVGDFIRRLCESEEGFFYQDEKGILRFENRHHYGVAPHNIPVWDLEPDDIIEWVIDEATPIYNQAVVVANKYELSGTAVVWGNASEIVLERNEVKEIYITFNDPVNSITSPVATTDYTAFTATAGGGTNITTSLGVVVDLYGTTARFTLTNNYNAAMYINFLQIRGVALEITEEVRAVAEDEESIEKYRAKQIVINNDFIQDQDYASYFANALVRKYGRPAKRLILTVQGIPQLQVRDQTRVKDIDTGMYINYRVMRIQGILADGLFLQKLYLREVFQWEYDVYAIVGITQVGSTSEIIL